MIAAAIAGSLLIGFSGLGKRFDLYSASAVSELLFLIPVLVAVCMDKFNVLRGVKLRPVGIRVILWSLLLGLLLLPVALLLNLLTQFLVPNAVSTVMSNLSAMPLWLNFLYIAVLPAIVEEYIFRGVFFQAFRADGLVKTALYTGAMFGLAHLNLNQFLYAMVMGVLFAFLDEAAGSVYASMLAHTVINGFNVLMFQLMTTDLPENVTSAIVEAQSRTSSVEDISLIWWILLTAIATACFILAIIIIRQIAKTTGREKLFSEACRGRDKLRGKEGRAFTVELLIGLLVPVVYIGVTMITMS